MRPYARIVATKIPKRTRDPALCKLAVTGLVGDQGRCQQQSRDESPHKGRSRTSLNMPWPRHRHVFCKSPREIRSRLRREEDLACVRIFYRASRRKTEDLDVTSIRCEGTGN